MTALIVINLIITLILGGIILTLLAIIRRELVSAFDDLKAAFVSYAAKVDAYVAANVAHQQTVDQAVAAAIAADDAGEDVDINALKDQIAASAANVPDAPVTPPTPTVP